TGAQLWVSRYDTGGNDDPQAVVAAPGGSAVFVTGATPGVYGTVAYDASTGGELWARRFSGPGGSGLAKAIAVSPDGSSVFVTGTSRWPRDSFDCATVAYDASTGARLWLAHYNGRNG